MKRQLLIDLNQWKNSPNRKPLLLRGARQVGKTHLVRSFGVNFEQFIEINFEKNPNLKKIFEYDLDPIRITKELSLILKKKITPGNTLLFIDEIQEAPKAIIALRYFYEEIPQLHVIAAGSLVDFAIDQVGVPVGRLEFLYMYPLSFIEYLIAKDYHDLAISIINHPINTPISDIIHTQALKLLGEYMAIGGMPEAVNHWIQNEDLELCSNILKNIKNAYEQDFSKYTKKHEIKYIDLLFKQIPSMICQHFTFSSLSTQYRKRELEPSLGLLEKAGIINQVFKSIGAGIPLGAQADFNKFKITMLDIGLNQAILGLELKDWFIDPIATLSNKGNMSESFVGQELLAYSNASDKHQLYYWQREQRGSHAEIDYLIASHQTILPIEVKSGHGGSLQSLKLFLETHSAPYGIRFSIHNYSIFDKIHSYPLYAVASIMNNKNKIIEFIKLASE